MSHFTVLVVGDDVEAQLQPFHEFECTGTADEHVVEVDQTDEVREYMARGHDLADALEYYGLSPVREGEEPDRGGEHKYGYAVVTRRPAWPTHVLEGIMAERLREEGADDEQVRAAIAAASDALASDELVRAVRRTNPNKQWDWWVVGGRWSGMLLLLKSGASGSVGQAGVFGTRHPNGGVDTARKRDVDFEAMRASAGERAGATYDEAAAVIAGRTWRTWREILDAEQSLDRAREVYGAQAVVADYSRACDAGSSLPWEGPDQFAVSRDEYVLRARRNAVSTFAVLMDGRWYERGIMGWWGVVHDEDEWLAQYEALLDGLPGDALLTIVDCHI